MGITYGDHLIDSGYYDITPEQEREIEAREECARRGLDPDEICADGGVTAWMVVDQDMRMQPPAGETIRTTQDGSMEPASVTGQSPVDAGSPSNAILDSSLTILRAAIDQFNPTHIVSMVSGGKDSAASDQIARELGAKVDFVMHGNTRCGIPETTDFVRSTYGRLGDYVEADAGTAYEDYVLRKGFFGKGIAAHGFAYRILKATPFRKAVSKHIRQGRRAVRVLLINGARKDESENRQKHLEVMRQDPASPGNIWVNLIHDWTQDDRDAYLTSRGTAINPVATALCRSGECMCGTMQTKPERTEAAVLYPAWGKWLSELEAEARALHGFGWGEPFPRSGVIRNTPNPQLGFNFQPMCKDCIGRAA